MMTLLLTGPIGLKACDNTVVHMYKIKSSHRSIKSKPSRYIQTHKPAVAVPGQTTLHKRS